MKICITTTQALGDVIMMSTLLEGLRNAGHSVGYWTGYNRVFLYAGYDLSIKHNNADHHLKVDFSPSIFRECESNGWHQIKWLSEWANRELGTSIDFPSKPVIYTCYDSPLIDGKYVALMTGGTNDTKCYPYWQQVVDLLPDVRFVQVGSGGWIEKLNGVEDWLGRTDIHRMINIVRFSQCVVSPVSSPTHIAGAYGVPSIAVVAGKEHPCIYSYPETRSISSIGTLPCCAVGGCYHQHLKYCRYARGAFARCMNEIKPEIIVDEIKKVLIG